jgi:transcriptional antiterminator
MFILWIIIMSTTKLQTREFLTTQQRSILITSYNRNPYPSATERHQLVQLTGRTLKQIQDWFSNRRVTISNH